MQTKQFSTKIWIFHYMQKGHKSLNDQKNFFFFFIHHLNIIYMFIFGMFFGNVFGFAIPYILNRAKWWLLSEDDYDNNGYLLKYS